MSEVLSRYRVYLRSTPGFYEQYNGYTEVFAENEDQAIERAFRELRRTAFPDRGPSMWKTEKVERVG